MHRIAALLFALTAWASADDPVEVLTRVRDKIMAHAARVPNHTCVETIVRDRYAYSVEPPRSCDALLGRRKRAGEGTLIRLATTDRLRLDVTLANTREIYSWAGAGKFDDREIDELVPPGDIGTGPFGATLLGLFEVQDPNFIYEGEKFIEARRVFEYSFKVTEEQSRYKVKAGREWVITGYTGTMLADPQTAELVRLNVRTEELPAATRACEVDSSLEYGAVSLAGADYLLPKLTRERFIETSGAEAVNTITFAACRLFQGESAVRFEEGTAVETPVSGAPSPPQWPPELPVVIELMSAIRLDQAAAGDRVEGRVVGPVLDANKQTVVPPGTLVEGRLMRVETVWGHPDEVGIALRWESTMVNGVKTPLSLTPDRIAERKRPQIPGEVKRKPRVFDLPREGEDAYVAYRLSGAHGKIEGGLTSSWITGKP